MQGTSSSIPGANGCVVGAGVAGTQRKARRLPYTIFEAMAAGFSMHTSIE